MEPFFKRWGHVLNAEKPHFPHIIDELASCKAPFPRRGRKRFDVRGKGRERTLRVLGHVLEGKGFAFFRQRKPVNLREMCIKHTGNKSSTIEPITRMYTILYEIYNMQYTLTQ